MNKELIELLGTKVEFRTPVKLPHKLTKTGKIRVKSADQFFHYDYGDDCSEDLKWDTDYVGYCVEDIIYIDGVSGYSTYKYPKKKILEQCTVIFTPTQIGEKLYPILKNIIDQVENLESRLDKLRGV